MALPDGFPEEVPFPPGTVITRARVTEAGGSYVEGYAPLTLVEAARFYLDEIPAAGYVHGRGDSEAHEAESPFTGHGIQGRWIVASVDNCPEAAALSVVTAELP